MSTTRTSMDDRPTKMVLLVVAEQHTAERYAEWLASRYPTGVVTDWRTALDVLGDDTAIIVLSCDLQTIAPLEFVDRAQTAGYDGKIVLITNPWSKLDTTAVNFDSVLSKPVSKRTLIETVEKFMNQVLYEIRLEQRLSLAKKKSRWEAEMSDEELESDSRYANLVAELNGLDTELENILSCFESDDFSALFRGVLS